MSACVYGQMLFPFTYFKNSMMISLVLKEICWLILEMFFFINYYYSWLIVYIFKCYQQVFDLGTYFSLYILHSIFLFSPYLIIIPFWRAKKVMNEYKRFHSSCIVMLLWLITMRWCNPGERTIKENVSVYSERDDRG